MNQQEHEEIAELLLEAYASREPVEPLTAKFPGLTVGDAYEIQLLQVRRWLAGGAQVKGHKVGLTSAAMQRQLGVDQPDYGHLLDRMFWLEHEPIPASRFLQPRVEPEIAFVLARPLRGPGVTVAEAIAAVDFVLPALELIDSRIRDWKIGLADTIADNASSGGVVLGSTPGPPGRGRPAAGRLHPAPERGAGRDRRGRRGARLAAHVAGVAGQHGRGPRRGAGGRARDPARLDDRVGPGAARATP